MPAFLEKVADFILAHPAAQQGQLCVVLPNRRAGLFLRHYLAQRIDEAQWSPAVFSVEDFIAEITGLRIADQAEQLFALYSIYAADEEGKAESFDMFSRWAPALLNDFSEIDNYLVDAKQLFGNLADIRNIENWSLGQTQLTEFQKQYMKFWEALGRWYYSFTGQLSNDALATPGMAARYAAEHITTLTDEQPWSLMVFAGFNALTAAEEKIISRLRKAGKAEILWDADRYYYADVAQEAGRFLRKANRELFKAATPNAPEFRHTEDTLAGNDKTITVVGVARHAGQARAAAHFLKQLDAEALQSPKTAVVLADEQLLLPMLHALPDETGRVNITMGYPLRHTAVASLVDTLFSLHEHAKRFGIRTREGELKYYHTDLSRLLRHPWVRMLFAPTHLTDRLADGMARRNVVFIAPSQLLAFEENADATQAALLQDILRPWNEVNDAFAGMNRIIAHLRRLFTPEDEDKTPPLDYEFLFQLSRILNRMQTLTARWPFMNDLRTLRLLMAQQIAQAALPFYGEPLAGLQVMGLLETRTLDFENVILLSANENILPSGRSQHSFIVFDLRRGFGLPVWHERDAVFAYHFYHLLQRSKNVVILYNTESDTFGSGERSRFVTQLLHELPQVSRHAVIREMLFDSGVKTGDAPPPIVVQKDEAVLEKLYELAASGLSPSALNSFRDCSLKFYFSYVAQLREAEEVEETIGANTLGTVIHATLEELYEPLLGVPLTPELVKKLQDKAPAVCEKQFAVVCPPDETGYGKNLLAKRIALRYLSRYFDAEHARIVQLTKAGIPAQVEALEEELRIPITVAGREMTLRGTADRIDRNGDQVQLIDYKTGRTADKELKFAEWEEIVSNADISKSFQLLMYALLYQRLHPETASITSGIVSFRDLKGGVKKVRTPFGDLLRNDVLTEFELQLNKLLQLLINPEIPFVQTDDWDKCRICPFIHICNRQ
ncbi:MAG: PD-(D/E)XK nuclease family protein [Bacteroidia bacterium]|nr:PD-(D/E)XK nuclease family protein [Bacteroidia bacterium]